MKGKILLFNSFFEGDFVASFDSLYKRTPSLFYLESIEPTELTAIRREDFYNQINNNLSLRQLYEKKLIDRFHAYQQLFLSRIKNTPQQRYEELLKEYPNIIPRVPTLYSVLSWHHSCFFITHQKSSLTSFLYNCYRSDST